MIKWSLQTIPIKMLKEHARNPRQIKKDQLERLSSLMDEFGLIDKPIVNLDYTIIGGHQRLRILKKKKIKEVDCWVADQQLSDEQVDHLCIGLNLNQGSWDWDKLANEWEPLDLLQWGFSEEQLVGICKEAEDILEEEKEKNNKSRKKSCPNCGCEL